MPGKMDEAISIWRDSVMPAMSELDGFDSARLFVDRDQNRLISESLWDTQEELESSGPNSAALQTQIAKFAAVFTGPPVIEHFEVGAEF